MAFSLIPRGFYTSITAIDPKKLREKGITLVLTDLDNTLVPYKVTTPTPACIQWRDDLKAEGIDLFILSNSRRPTRVTQFAEQLEVPFLGHAGKPKKGGFARALAQMGRKPEETIMVGDQIFTDIWGANRSGIAPLLVFPIRMAGNPGRYVRYAIETPFRMLGKRRPLL